MLLRLARAGSAFGRRKEGRSLLFSAVAALVGFFCSTSEPLCMFDGPPYVFILAFLDWDECINPKGPMSSSVSSLSLFWLLCDVKLPGRMLDGSTLSSLFLSSSPLAGLESVPVLSIAFLPGPFFFSLLPNSESSERPSSGTCCPSNSSSLELPLGGAKMEGLGSRGFCLWRKRSPCRLASI